MADIIKFPSSVKKIGDIIDDDFLLDLLYRAAMNKDSKITMEDYEKYKETGSFAEGGMMNINDMTGSISSPKRGYVDEPGSYAGEIDDFPFGKPGDPGYSTGTDPTVDPLKDTRRPASARISTKKPYVMFLKDAGYTKNASIDDVKDYAKKFKIKIKVGQVIGSPSAFRNTLSALGVKEKTQQADNVLNQALKRAKKPLYVPGAKAAIDIGEELISVVTNTEFGHPNTKKERDKAAKKIKNLKTQGNKMHGANPSKAKNAFFKETLERMWPILKNTTKGAAVLSTTLAKTALGKALGPLDLLITTPTGLDPSDIEPTIMEQMESAKTKAAELGIEPTTKLFKGGGMADIYDMTQPLGYALGGPAGMTEPERKSAQPVTMSQIMRDMEASEDIRLPGKSFSSIVTERQPVNPYHDLTRSNLERGKELGKKGLEGIRSLFGAKAAESSTLADSAKDIRILGMKLELQKVLSLDMIDKMEEMGPIEIEILYDETFGK